MLALNEVKHNVVEHAVQDIYDVTNNGGSKCRSGSALLMHAVQCMS